MVTDEQLTEIEAVAADLQAKSDVLIAIGIGGSYLGARAVIGALSPDASRIVRREQHLGATSCGLNRLACRETGRAERDFQERYNHRTPLSPSDFCASTSKKTAGVDAAKDLIVATTDKKKGAVTKSRRRDGLPHLPN